MNSDLGITRKSQSRLRHYDKLPFGNVIWLFIVDASDNNNNSMNDNIMHAIQNANYHNNAKWMGLSIGTNTTSIVDCIEKSEIALNLNSSSVYSSYELVEIVDSCES